nr:integrase, catalytic region, zinc finger, CCHC-type, peptidase aspartic, catalytic [Tanacetum cinerariifolium]
MPVILNENVIPKGYRNHLKDTLDTLREMVEEARSKRTSDNSLEYACVYTKTSQELLENVIALCPKTAKKRDRYNASTHAERNKHVTFAKPLKTSPNNTSTHVKHLNEPKTNVSAIPSTRVNSITKASKSQPRSNTKIDRTLPAKSGHTKNVEAHLRNNKSDLHKKNRVDSGISFKRAVVNSNSNSHCKTCNKCTISVNHDECVAKFLKSSNKSPVKKIWRVKQVNQTWQLIGTLFTNVGYQWRPIGRTFTLGEQCPLTRNSKPNVVPVKQWKPTGRIILLGCQCPLIRPHASTSGQIGAKSQTKHVPVAHNVVCTNQQEPNCNWGSDLPNSPFSSVFKCRTVRFRNDHFGAIMGYGDYVIGDSVISRVYYVEGLEHNLLSVGQFCDSDLEVAFRKHTCFVRDLDGVDLIKGTRGTNLYIISVEDMMRVSMGRNTFSSSTMIIPGLHGEVFENQGRNSRAIATACYTQNRSLIHTLYNKTPYEMVHDKKPDMSFLRVFGALCYPTNNSEDLGKLQAKADIGFFIGLGPTPKLLTPGPISSGLVSNSAIAIPYVPPTNQELEMLFQPMFDEYFDTPPVSQPVPPASAVHDLVFQPAHPAPADHSPSVHQGVAVDHTLAVNPFAPVDDVPFVLLRTLALKQHHPRKLVQQIPIKLLYHMNISGNRPTLIRLTTLLGIPLDQYLPTNNLLPMPCGVSIILYCRKSNQKPSNLLLLKIVGLSRCKKKSMNLIAFKYGN